VAPPRFEAHPRVAHRGGLATRVPALRPAQDLFERLGGRAVTDRIARELYAGIETDPELRPLFPRNLAPPIQKQADLLEEWTGGAKRWNTYRGLVDRHHMRITREHAQRWLQHFQKALKRCAVGAAERKELIDVARPIALALVNEAHGARSISLGCPHLYEQARRLAGKGDRTAVAALMADEAWFATPGDTGIQILLFHAARRGHTELVADLLERGADVNVPDGSSTFLPVSAYATARAQKKHATADFLLERGALVDIFSAAYLGDLERLESELDAAPELVHVHDPAMDYADVQPLEHAIEGEQLQAAALLLERGASVGACGHERLEQALGLEQRGPFLKLLLEHGATAKGIEPDDWLLDEPTAKLMFAHGADFSQAGDEWIEFCTGHHGNRENSELIQALVDHGVRVDQRTDKGRTGLHCATRVGFTAVMGVLLEAGADVNARDAVGDTPLAYVFQARKNVDVERVARVLLDAGADPTRTNEKGESPLTLARKARKPQLKALAQLFEQHAN